VEEDFPDSISCMGTHFQKALSMRYGENPGYPAAFYREEGASGPNMASIRVLQQGSKGLGYINMGDMDLGQRLAGKLTVNFPRRKICVLVKHEIPSGVAMGENPVEVFLKAWKCDPLSNFGSVDVFNYEVTRELAETIIEKGRNAEVVYAPDFTPDALEVLASRKPLRVVKMGGFMDRPAVDRRMEFKRLAGGILVQKRFESRIVSPESVEVVSRKKASPRELKAAVFLWAVACFTRSNAIVIGTEDKVHGIGSGQQRGFGKNRVMSLPDAVGQALAEHIGLHNDAMLPGLPDEEDVNAGYQTTFTAPPGDICPVCGNATLLMIEGCKKCHMCGYSEC
jgi:phosphoribosylaminoimidazolecarboxamide formyltransferase/IMP cyclohydrolase